MKRFYKIAARGDREAEGYPILLDGKPVRTPGGGRLIAPTLELAEAIAAEWGAQEKEIKPAEMVLTQILTTAQESDEVARPLITKQILGYLDTDLLCYRADFPPELVQRQAQGWDSILHWFENTCGVKLVTTTSLAALKQPAAAHVTAEQMVAKFDDLRFTVCQTLTALTGSLILAIAFTSGAAGADDLYNAMHVEEDYKAVLYNEAEHGSAPLQEKRQKNVRRELDETARFLAFLGPVEVSDTP